MRTNSLTRTISLGIFVLLTMSCASNTSVFSYDKDLYLEADEVLEVRVNEREGDFRYWTFDLTLSAEASQRLDIYSLNVANIGEKLFLTNKHQTVSLVWLSPYSDIGNYSASIMINTQGEYAATIACLDENAHKNVLAILLN